MMKRPVWFILVLAVSILSCKKEPDYSYPPEKCRELVSLYISGLSTAQEMLNLAYRINESDDPADISMRSGYPSIQYVYIALLSSALNQQSLFSVYPGKDPETLADSSSSRKIKGGYLKFIDGL